MDSGRRQGIDRSGENNASVVSNDVNLLNYFWTLVGKILCLIGKKVDIWIGIAIITFLGLSISGFSQTSNSGLLAALEHKSTNAKGAYPVIVEMINGPRLDMFPKSKLQNYGIISYMNLLPTVTPNVDPAENILRQKRMLGEDPDTCPCSISGFAPALSKWETTSNGSSVVSLYSGIQWTVMEEENLLTSDSKGSKSPLLKPSETCQEHQSVIGSLQSTSPAYADTVESQNCKIKQGVHDMKGKLQSSSQYEKTLDECEHFSDNQVFPSEATFQDKVNGDLLQRSGNNIINDESNVAFGDASEENSLQVSNLANFLKNNFWRLLSFLVLFLDGMLCFIEKMLYIGLRVVTIIALGLGIPGIVESSKNGQLVTPISWFDFPVLMYLIAYDLMFLSLILQYTPRREWLSQLTAGTSYTFATLGIFSIIVSPLPLEYMYVCVALLVVLAVLYGYILQMELIKRE